MSGDGELRKCRVPKRGAIASVAPRRVEGNARIGRRIARGKIAVAGET